MAWWTVGQACELQPPGTRRLDTQGAEAGRKVFLPEGVSWHPCPPPEPRNPILHTPGHLACLRPPYPPAPSLIPCIPG